VFNVKRKKFVKQLMGLYPCQDRNTAQKMARSCQQRREPYLAGLERYKGILAWEKAITAAVMEAGGAA
jgi:hypothetical protein